MAGGDGKTFSLPKGTKLTRALAWGAAGLAVVLFVWGSMRQGALVNTNSQVADQASYMQYAEQMAETHFGVLGGRNRMPVYPALMSVFYRHGMSDRDFFELGKNVSVDIAAFVLALVFLLLYHSGRTLDAATGTLVTMFTVFAYKAPYFQAELLYYGISLLLFFLLVSLLDTPSIGTAALAGLVGGVAYLTKASVLPAIILAGALLVIRAVGNLWQRRHTPEHPAEASSRSRMVLRHFCCSGVLFLSFLLVIFPYITTSKKYFGHYFYNVNSTFYMWYDSWDEVVQGTRAHGDRVGWPDMPAEQIPSLSKYVRDHSSMAIVGRFARGFRAEAKVASGSYGYEEFVALYLLILTVLFLQNRSSSSLRGFLFKHIYVVLFTLLYFSGYVTIYAWYAPIANDNRFLLSLFLPAMLLFVKALSYAQAHKMTICCNGTRLDASAISPAILLLLTVYVLTVYPFRISTLFGGG